MWVVLLIIIVSVVWAVARHPAEPAGLPTDEVEFIHINKKWADNWNSAPNDIKQEPMRKARDTAICAVNPDVSNWTGYVKEIGLTVLSDDALLKITLPTASINLFDVIRRDSRLFDEVSSLAPGQSVIFSGTFDEGTETCKREHSWTDKGSMTDPDYQFTFTSISR